MNNVLKRISMVGLTSALLLTGVASVTAATQTHEAHAATKPYYNYNGKFTASPSVLKDSNFVRAVKYNNVTINGVKYNNAYTNKFTTNGGSVPTGGPTEFKYSKTGITKAKFDSLYGKPSDTKSGNDFVYQYGVSPNEMSFFGPSGKYFNENLTSTNGTFTYLFYNGKNVLDYPKAERTKYLNSDKLVAINVTFHQNDLVNFRFGY